MEKKSRILKSAFILGVGAVVAKILGAAYRIPLTNLIGGYGLGLYQTVFPVYVILLDFAGAGVPNAVSKIISSDRSHGGATALGYLKDSVKLLSVIGFVFSVALALCGRIIARLQGNESAYISYILLAPSVFLVAIISCYRGYFQGLSDMKPTAVSQIIEQAFKLVFGLAFAAMFLPDVNKSVSGAVLAITVSEFAALMFLIIYAKRKNEGLSGAVKSGKFFIHAKEIIKNAVPVTLTGMAIPFSHFIDSFLIVNVLSTYLSNATSLYGIFSGVGATVVNLPVSVCYAVAVATIPAVASSENLNESKAARDKALTLTFFLSVAGCLVCYFLSDKIIDVLFSRLVGAEKYTAVKVLKYSSFSVIFLSLLQTENAVLFGSGNLYGSLIGVFSGIAVKVLLSFLLIKNPALNIYGAVIAQTACYFLASLINLKQVFRSKDENKVATYRKLTTIQ